MNEAESKSLLIIADLYFAAKLNEAAKHLGYAPLGAGNLQIARKRVREARPTAIIVSMNKEGFDWETFVVELKDDVETVDIPILVFGSHVDTEGFRRAETAGADIVVANSQISANFPYLLTDLLRE